MEELLFLNKQKDYRKTLRVCPSSEVEQEGCRSCTSRRFGSDGLTKGRCCFLCRDSMGYKYSKVRDGGG